MPTWLDSSPTSSSPTRRIAQQCGRDIREMALQFALARQDVSVVLLGISRAAQLNASLRALSATELSAEERQLSPSARRPGRCRQTQPLRQHRDPIVRQFAHEIQDRTIAVHESLPGQHVRCTPHLESALWLVDKCGDCFSSADA